MGKINILDKHTAELLAAGEVVEKPASVVKELIENAVDAGADAVTVEIEHGGVLYIRVTDNGCGMSREDVPKAFLRHATSKISREEDLERIGTLGFRGEALAAISSVSRTEVLTFDGNGIGTHYVIAGGEELECADAGCPKGTTFIVRDLFYNTPARMKFLKKDVSEGNAVAAVVEKLSLSKPEISFKFIRDGRQIFMTSGDGNLENTVYAVLGREFSSSMIPVSTDGGAIAVSGFTCKPANCRANRTSQYFFLNGRLIKSDTMTAALEQAYKNAAMIGRFPSCVLNITMDPSQVDVNVHPAKTEVRFADKKPVFDAVYYAVRSAVEQRDDRPEMTMRNLGPARKTALEIREAYVKEKIEGKQTTVQGKTAGNGLLGRVLSDPDFSTYDIGNRAGLADTKRMFRQYEVRPAFAPDRSPLTEQRETAPLPEAKKAEEKEAGGFAPPEDIKYIGEIFKTYIIAEVAGEIYFIDKHAAHERILYNEIKTSSAAGVQMLLPPVSVTLSREDYDTITGNLELLAEAGFMAEDFGSAVLVTAVPAPLVGVDVSKLTEEFAKSLSEKRVALSDRLERIYETAACRAAIKAGNISGDIELEALAKRVLGSREIMYCPHGRPVAIKLTRQEIERRFGRLG